MLTLLLEVGVGHDKTGPAAVGKLICFRQQILRLLAFKKHVGTAVSNSQNQQRHRR